MVKQFGTALVALGQDCATDYAGKQSPPYTLLVISARDSDGEKTCDS